MTLSHNCQNMKKMLCSTTAFDTQQRPWERQKEQKKQKEEYRRKTQQRAKKNAALCCKSGTVIRFTK